jgi:hypothetical protein
MRAVARAGGIVDHRPDSSGYRACGWLGNAEADELFINWTLISRVLLEDQLSWIDVQRLGEREELVKSDPLVAGLDVS